MILNKKILSIIFLGLIISLSLSFFNILKFDKNSLFENGNFNHKMIKSDILYHYENANKTKNDLLDKNYFQTGDFYNRNYLPSKIFLIYSLLTNDKFFDKQGNNKFIPINNKKYFILIFQSLFYFICLYFFSTKLIIISNERIGLFTCIFLSFEPTILQWHSSFWTESIFLSFQILFLTIVFLEKKNNITFLILGFILGLMFLQRSAATFYLVPVLIYFYIYYKNFKFKIFCFLIGYFFIFGFIGYHNFERSGILYFTPADQKIAFAEYMLPTIISKNERISRVDANEKIEIKKNKIISENNLNLNIEKDFVVYSQKLRNYTFLYFIKNPVITFNHVAIKSLHFGVLDPVWGYYFHVYDRAGKDYINSQDHAFWVKYRLIYSVLIYLIVILGLLNSRKKIKTKFNIIFVLSLIYFFFILSWIGFTRYFTPCLIYLSLYFSIGIEKILELKKKKNY